MTESPPAWGWVAPPSTILRNSPFARGGVRVKRGSCPAAGAGGQPPHGYIIHRMRKPSRSGTHSRRPGVAQREEGDSLCSPPGPAASSSAQLPDQLCAGHRPGHARYAIQHGGSDHRRPSNVETGTPAPSPISPPKHHQSESKAVFLSIPLSTGVASAAKPASNPAPPPTQVVNTITHHVPLKLAQLAPPTLLTGPTSGKKP